MANSFVRYTGNNSTTAYSIPFSYISTNDLTVTLAGVATTAFTLNAAGTTLTFNSPPASNVAIEIRRTTSQTTRLTDYASGSVLTENDLDTDSEQAFFMGQEAIDDANDVIKISNVNFQYDATNKRITNVADPVNAQDLTTKNYLENTWLTTANKTALTTVNANIANINAVNNNASNINSAVSNATNINTVATNIGSVNTVATDIAKVITVANDLAEAVSEVETVADDLNETSSEIDTVAGAITNVNNVGNNIANVNTVAGISSNVTTVGGISSQVQTVASNSSSVNTVAQEIASVQAVNNIVSNVTTVAGISSDVTSVAGISTAVSNVNSNSSNINAVNSNATNINTVAGNNSNISTVAGVSSDVTTVAGISSDVQAVENIASNVTTVAGMSTAINTVNSNATNINAVGGAITNVNNVGGSIASVNSVATNLASVNSFANTYLGASSSAPTQDPDGSALDLGDLYFSTSDNQLKVYSSTGWVNAGSSVNGTSDRFKYTISGTPTAVSGNDDNSKSLSYDAGFIDVFLNGIKMVNGTDVTVTSGNSVVFASALTNGDVVDIVTFGTFNISSMNASNLTSGTVPDARITGAYTGITNLTMSGDLTVDTNTLFVDASENTVVVGGTDATSWNANADELVVAGASAGGMTFYNPTQTNIFFADGTSGDDLTRGRIQYVHSDNSLRFGTDTSERARIDSSGRLLVGKTSTTRTVAGAEIRNDGMIRGTRNTAHSIDAVRTSDDGDVIRIYKDNNIAGVLGTQKWGIGNANPQNKLDISATTWDDGILIKNTGNFNTAIIADANRSGAGGGILNLASKWNGTEVAGILFQAGTDTTNKDDGEILFRTASAGTAQEKVRITNAGLVGIGTSSPSEKLDVSGNINLTDSLKIDGAINFEAIGSSSQGNESIYKAGNYSIGINTNGAEMARFSDSRLLINSTANVSSEYLLIKNNYTRSGMTIKSNTTNAHHAIEFHNPNNQVGSINTTGSATQYNTSSDYRLKENVSYDFDATSRLKQLKPARFNFIADADTTVDGFLAHEVSSAVPEAVFGEKDAVDDDGNPKYQGIDQSKLVPLLVKTIQELEARITTLENN